MKTIVEFHLKYENTNISQDSSKLLVCWNKNFLNNLFLRKWEQYILLDEIKNKDL